MSNFSRETSDVSSISFSRARLQSASASQRQTFYPSLYSDAIKYAVTEFGFSEHNTRVSTDIQYKGTSNKKGHFLVSKNDESIEFWERLIILIQNDAAVYFVVDIHKADCILNTTCTQWQNRVQGCNLLTSMTWEIFIRYHQPLLMGTKSFRWNTVCYQNKHELDYVLLSKRSNAVWKIWQWQQFFPFT